MPSAWVERSRRAAGIVGLVLIAGVLARPGTANAQGGHYWSNQYGTRSQLLGGVVVGRGQDLSATYYNPGWIAMTTRPALLFTAHAVEFISVRQESGDGSTVDLSSFESRPSPRIFAGQFMPDWLKGNRVVLSWLTRHSFEIDLVGRRIDEREPGPVDPNQSFAAGEVIFGGRLSETWLGLTWAHLLGRKVGLGVTQYVAIRSQRGGRQLFVQEATPSGEGSAAIVATSYDYSNVRALWKAGVAAELGAFTCGVAVTTPSVNLFGSGSMFSNASIVGAATDTIMAELASDYQQDLASHYRSPVSIALGAAAQFGNTVLYVTGEWFDAEGTYAILSPEPFIAQTTGQKVSRDLIDELNSVFNVGIGVEQIFGQSTTGFVSVVTDASSHAETRESVLAFAPWDLFHVAVGGAFSFQRVDFTLGLGYGRGKEELTRLVDFTGSDSLGGAVPPSLGTVLYQRLRLIFGLEVAF